MFHVPEKNRIRTGFLGSDETSGNNGAFFVRNGKGVEFKIIASDGMGWEHVSVSLGDRCPTWEEMVFVKNLFWDPDDCVVQFHPARKDYVNSHPFCLHLWRPTEEKFPVPDKIMVGI